MVNILDVISIIIWLCIGMLHGFITFKLIPLLKEGISEKEAKIIIPIMTIVLVALAIPVMYKNELMIIPSIIHVIVCFFIKIKKDEEKENNEKEIKEKKDKTNK